MVQQVAQIGRSTRQQSPDSRGACAPEDADVHASSAEYAKRFAGSTGSWFLKIQTDILLSMVSTDTESILDIGGGHGQTAIPLHRAGKSVTVLGSSSACTGQLSREIDAGCVSFKVGNLIELPYGPRSFDTAVSFRLISHCSNWRILISEMCRVADHTVIFDYPSWGSVNICTPLLFRVKRKIEGNTRRYTLFTTSELKREFAKHGFRCTSVRKQFFFPMGIHRALRSPAISRLLEGCAASFGLTRLLGSPIIIRFERSPRD
jgi:2-polyprenyl-3-methyl-5-hydroxy-6-metoxy-1,4-benzoquinol methylase